MGRSPIFSVRSRGKGNGREWGKERREWDGNSMKLWQKRKNLRLSRESNMDTLTNVADALQLIDQDRRHHLPVCSTSWIAVPPLHNIDIMQCPLTKPTLVEEGPVMVAIVHPVWPERLVVGEGNCEKSRCVWRFSSVSAKASLPTSCSPFLQKYDPFALRSISR